MVRSITGAMKYLTRQIIRIQESKGSDSFEITISNIFASIESDPIDSLILGRSREMGFAVRLAARCGFVDFADAIEKDRRTVGKFDE